MKKWLVLLVSCFALVAAGCGDDDDGGGGGAEATTEQPAQQPAETGTETEGGGAKTVEVSMKNTLFVPMDVRVSVGDTIKWTNDDPIPHTVTKESGPGPKFDSGTVDESGTFEQKFDTAGKIDYVCMIHPNQTGSITVE